MSLRLFVPGDTTARALGANAIAAACVREAAKRGIDVDIVRTGSRGAYWLEPLLEVDTDAGRIGFGPLAVGHVADLFAAAFPAAGHPLALGRIDELPWLARQNRLTFARAGVIDPLSLDDYRAHGGCVALERALQLSPQAIIDAVKSSGLRGRGGAAFPAGIKWQTVHDAIATQKFVVCNAEEGDSGSFADRLLIESDPFQLIEAMAIAGIAVGATQGYIGLREEYPHAATVLRRALDVARTAGLIGASVLGSAHAFDIELRIGGGAYVCGEETALLESLEGKRGMVRAKPPLPALHGLHGQPTLVNNVLTLAAVATILAQGAEAHAALGSGRSRGTLALQIGGNVRRGGLVEVPFGITLREVIDHYAGGTRSGRPVRAVQVGGPLGAYMGPAQFDLPLDYEAFAAAGALVGHGGVVVFDDRVDLLAQARFAMEFCALESCGKCTPCRIGSTRGVELIDRIAAGEEPQANRALLDELCDTLEHASLCALGGLTPLPVRSALALCGH